MHADAKRLPWSRQHPLTFDQCDFTKMHPLSSPIADGDAPRQKKSSRTRFRRTAHRRDRKGQKTRLPPKLAKQVALPPGQKRAALYPGVAPPDGRARSCAGAQHPELRRPDHAAGRTTKPPSRCRPHHWNASTLTPMDPVTPPVLADRADFEVQRPKEKTDRTPMAALPCCRPPKHRKKPEFERPTSSARISTRCVFAKLKTIGKNRRTTRTAFRPVAHQPAADP